MLKQEIDIIFYLFKNNLKREIFTFDLLRYLFFFAVFVFSYLFEFELGVLKCSGPQD